jgi:hypothetical protein
MHLKHHLGKFSVVSNPNVIESDGAIISNPYNKWLNQNRGTTYDTAYIVKNAIWDKWYNGGNNGIGKVVGVPQGGQTTVTTQTTCDTTFLEYQNFRGADNQTSNQIRVYGVPTATQSSSNGCTVNSSYKSARFVVGSVAKQFVGQESYFGIPTNDTTTSVRDNTYCKQTFSIRNIDNCLDFSNDYVNNKEIRYEMYLANGNTPSQYTGGKVWILVHGWNDDSYGKTCELKTTIQTQDPTASVICIDWSSIANQGFWQGFGDLVFTQGPQPEASYVGLIAGKVGENLRAWQGTNNLRDNLYIAGHSLGTLLGAQISSEMGGIKELIAFAPPGRSNLTGYYSVNGQPFDSYQSNVTRNFTKAQFVRAYVAQGEIADNPALASTADESFLVDYTTLSGGGGKHGGFSKSGMATLLFNNPNPFTRANTNLQQYSPNNSLPTGQQKTDITNSFSGFIRMTMSKPDYLKVAEDGGVPGNNYTLYGTSGDDDINDNQLVNKKYTIKQGGGNDKITSYDDYGNRMQYNFISWQSGSRIKFANGGASVGACTVERTANNLTIVTNELWCTFNGQQLLTARFEGVTPNDVKLKWEAFRMGADENTQKLEGTDKTLVLFQ